MSSRDPASATGAVRDAGACVVLPTYNNARTLASVIDRVRAIAGDHVAVVNDGSTDGTRELLESVTGITITHLDDNKGKGNALRTAFAWAREQGYRYAITLDTDGQHDPADIATIAKAIVVHPGAMIMGARDMTQETVPGKSSFGNRFSNFWFLVETGIRLPDTQTGFRAYPLEAMAQVHTTSDRFGFEVESIVKLAWRGVVFHSVPVKVDYALEDRVSHFRPFTDFLLISWLNTGLVIAALLWHWPRRIFSPRRIWRTIMQEAIKQEESSLRKASSIGFGLFMGIVPIWGFQLLVGIPLALLFRLNKVLFVLAAHISIPPMIPLIIYASYRTGALFIGDPLHDYDLTDMSLEAIRWNLTQYLWGAVTLAVCAGAAGFLLSLPVIRGVRGK
mgnify:CR=1 FL=1